MSPRTVSRGARRPPVPQKKDSLTKRCRAIWKMVMHNPLKEFNIKNIITDFNMLCFVSSAMLIVELIANVVIIEKVPYTEIDWKAYMQEVEGVVNGTFDYSKLKGDTGPLVYPAGFVYIFLGLYYLTGHGQNIYLAQYLFGVLYLLTLYVIFHLYLRTKKVPAYVLVIMCCTSYRIHSIYALRLFNDPVAMYILYAALSCFISRMWVLGCVLYSFAVSVKMNILLFSPALLFLLIATQGYKKTVLYIGLCGIIQLLLGLPFLISNPYAYIKGSFDLGRVFLYEWTVNWRFLPEELFVSRKFHVILLTLHLAALIIFIPKWRNYFKMIPVTTPKGKVLVMFPDQILLPLFTANFLGVMFSRSLHYQFYVWYYHSIPYLLWSTNLAPVLKLCIWGLIELSWNTFPSTYWSSLLLHCCHITLFCCLYKQWPDMPHVIQKKD